MKGWLICAGLMLAAYFAWAADHAAATTGFTDVSNALFACAAGGGDRALVPAGTSTWAGLVITNACTIVGNGTNQTGGRTRLINPTTAGAGLETAIFTIKLKGDGSIKVEISDIDLQDQNLDWNSDGIDVPGAVYGGAESGGIFERAVVIHNCRFEGFAFAEKHDGDWGLSYSNEWVNCANTLRVKGFNMLANLPVSNPESYKWSSTNYYVYEDCLFTFVNWTDKDIYLMDTEWPANYMVRFCTANINRGGAQNRGIDGFDMHGEDGAGDAHVPCGAMIYGNTVNYTGNNTVSPNKFGDIRGGANSLILSNTATGDPQYCYFRDDQSPGNLMTNSYIKGNVDPGGSAGTDFNSEGQDGVTYGVHYFSNSLPSNLIFLQYPHPLRPAAGGGGSPSHNHKIGAQTAIGGRRR